MTTPKTTQAGERTLCPNCGHDQDGQQPTHCLSCAWPLPAGAETHTPGPWTTESIESENRMGNELFVIPEDNSEDWIAKMAGHGHSKADARLIAAAPELLEALKHWQHVWEETQAEHDDCMSASDEAKAAIAKATKGGC